MTKKERKKKRVETVNSTQHVEGVFCPNIFFQIWGENILVGLEIKHLNPNNFFFPPFLPTKHPLKTSFLHFSLIFFFFFHPLYSTSKQIYPKCLHGYIHITDLYLDQDQEIFLFILNTVYIYKKLKLGSKNLYPKIKN